MAHPAPGWTLEIWPSFLDALDSDPVGAGQSLYLEIDATCRLRLPREAGLLRNHERADVVQIVYEHLARDGFRALRTYRPTGRGFRAWLFTVVRHKVRDLLKVEAGRAGREVPLPSGASEIIPNPAPGPAQTVEKRRELELVVGCLRRASDRCRLLIFGRAEGYDGHDLARLLGWPADRNHHAMTMLFDCRRRLAKCALAAGLDPGLLPPSLLPQDSLHG